MRPLAFIIAGFCAVVSGGALVMCIRWIVALIQNK